MNVMIRREFNGRSRDGGGRAMNVLIEEVVGGVTP
jgi:hypothetical protein